MRRGNECPFPQWCVAANRAVSQSSDCSRTCKYRLLSILSLQYSFEEDSRQGMDGDEDMTKATLIPAMALSSSIRMCETTGKGSVGVNRACFISTSLLAGYDRKLEKNTCCREGKNHCVETYAVCPSSQLQ